VLGEFIERLMAGIGDDAVRDEGYWEGWADGQVVLKRDLMKTLDLVHSQCEDCDVSDGGTGEPCPSGCNAQRDLVTSNAIIERTMGLHSKCECGDTPDHCSVCEGLTWPCETSAILRGDAE